MIGECRGRKWGRRNSMNRERSRRDSQLNSILYKLFFLWFASLALTWQFQFNPGNLSSRFRSAPPLFLALCPPSSLLRKRNNDDNNNAGKGRADFSSFQSDATVVLQRERMEGEKRQSWFLPGSLGFSQFVGSLPNSMHVLMKHCWPAAHCQRHCCIDDWSIEGPRAFARKPTLSSRRPPSNSVSLSLSRVTYLVSWTVASCVAILERIQNNAQEFNRTFLPPSDKYP